MEESADKIGEDSDSRMTILDHLEELRDRLIRILFSSIVVFVLVYTVARQQVLELLTRPLRVVGNNLHSIAPQEAFFYNLKLSFFAALILVAPHWLYEAWKFVAPGLYREEKRVATPCVAGLILTFFTGVMFAYKYVLPSALYFFTSEHGMLIIPSWSYKLYIDFCIKLFIAFGLGFELPWILFFLARFGIVTSDGLLRNFRYAIVVIFVLAAVLTPPDVFTQILLAIPLVFLYLLGVLMAKFGEPSEREQEG